MTTAGGSPAGESAGQGGGGPRRRWVKRLVIGLAVLLVIVVAMALLAPTWVSSAGGTRWLVAQVNSRIAGTVEIDDLDIGWWSAPQVKGLTLKDPQGGQVLRVGELRNTGLSLWSLMLGTQDYGQSEVVAPKLNYVQYPDGTTNLTSALARTDTTTSADDDKDATPAQPRAQVHIVDGEATYTLIPARDQPTIAPVQVLGLDGELVVQTLRDVRVTLKTARVQQAGLAGSIGGTVTVKDLYDERNQPTPTLAKVEAKVNGNDLPTAALAALAQQNPSIAALVGPRLDVTVDASGGGGTHDATFIVKSEYMTLTGRSQADAQGMRLVSADGAAPGIPAPGIPAAPLALKLRVTQENWSAFTTAMNPEYAAKLERPFDVEVTVSELSAPRAGEGFNWSAGAAKANAKVGDIALSSATLGTVALRGANVDLMAKELGKLLEVTAKLSAERDKQSGTLDFTAKLRDWLGEDNQLARETLKAEVRGNIVDLPLAVFDQLLPQSRGMITRVLGPQLGATLAANVAPDQPPQTQAAAAADRGNDEQTFSGILTFTAKSSTLDAQFDAKVDHNRIALDPGKPNRATLAMSRETLHELTKLDVSAGAKAEMTLSQLSAPSYKDLRAAVVHAKVALDQLALSASESVQAVTLEAPSLVLTADQLGKGATLVLRSTMRQAGQASALSATVTARDLLDAAGQLDLKHWQATVTGGSERVPVALLQPLVPSHMPLAQALGQDVALKLSGDLAANAKTRIGIDATKLRVEVRSLQGEGVQLALTGGIADDVLTLTTPEESATLTVPPAFVEAMLKGDSQEAPAYRLAEPAQVVLQLKHLAWPLDPERRGQAELELGATVDRISIVHQSGAMPRIEKLALSMPRSRLGEKLSAHITGNLIEGNQAGSLDGTLEIAQPLLATRQVSGNLTVNDMPVALADALAGANGKLLVLGPTLKTVKVIAKPMAPPANWPAGTSQVGLDVTIDSPPHASARLIGRVINSPSAMLIEFDPNATAALTITTQAWSSLLAGAKPPAADSPSNMPTLRQPWEIKLTAPKLQVAYVRSQPSTQDVAVQSQLDPARTAIDLKLTGGPATFVLATGQEAPIRSLAMAVKSDNPAKTTTIELTLEPQDGGAAAALTMKADATLTQLLDERGQFNQAFGYQAHAQGTLPTAIIDAMLKRDGLLVALLGQTATLDGQGAGDRGKGSFTVSVKSPNLTADKLRFDMVTTGEDQAARTTLSLPEGSPAVVNFMVTPELSRVYLAKLSAIIEEARSAKDPAKVTISRLIVPVMGAGDERVTADLRLELGTLMVQRSKGFLGGLLLPTLEVAGLNLRSTVPGGEGERGEFPAQFTPMDIHTADGKTQTNDVWMKAGDLVVGTKASVFPGPTAQGPNTVSMILGLSGQTLNRIRGLQGRVPVDRVFEIRGTGVPGETLFTKDALNRELVKLSIQVGASSQLGGSTGDAVGGLLGQVLSKDKGGEPVKLAASGWPNKPMPPESEPEPAPEQVTPDAAPQAAPRPAPAQPADAQPAPPAQPEAAPPAKQPTLLEELLRQQLEKREAEKKKEELKKQEKKRKAAEAAESNSP